MKRKSLIIIITTVLIAAVAAVAAVVIMSIIRNKNQTVQTDAIEYRQGPIEISYQGEDYVYNEDLETILLIGLDDAYDADKGSYNNQVQSDFVTVVVIDREQQKVSFVQLNRDTMCDMPKLDVRGNESGTAYGQLALAHTYGSGGKDSCRNVVKTVENLLFGIDIKHYISISYSSIGPLNDAVGGVTVTLEDDYTDVDPEMTKGKTLTLKGKQAEYYVRNRSSLEDSTNIHRMARQKNYMHAWAEQAKKTLSQGNVSISDWILPIADDMVSDMSVYVLSDEMDRMLGCEIGDIYQPKGESGMQDGYMTYILDDEALKKLVVDLFFKKK